MTSFQRLMVMICILSGLQACNFDGPQQLDPATIDALRAHRVSGTDRAQVCRVSLPLPRSLCEPLVFTDRPTQVQPVGYWPADNVGRRPRRMMLYTCGAALPQLDLTKGKVAVGDYDGPIATVQVIDKRYESILPWEVNELAFSHKAGSLGIRVGLKIGDGYHWWQWVTMEVLDEGPVCRTIRAQGAIPVHWERQESPEARQAAAKKGWAVYPWLHKHNHVRGEILARCYANGVIELYVRHVNGRFFTEGKVVEGVVPVIGFRGEGSDWPTQPQPVTGPHCWHWTHASLDTADAAHLVSNEHPGRTWREDDLCIYQPYEGVEPMAGRHAKQRTGDDYLCRAKDRKIPKGMGRTVRMVAALGDVEPEVAAYVLPDWWYAICEDLSESPLLPVRDHTFVTVQKALNYYRQGHHRGCFDDGAIPRGGAFPDGEPGWEGEAPHAQMIGAYLTGQAVDYDLALRSAYHVADVAVDKTIFAVRMHGYDPPAQSLPMQRTMGLVAAYLETADPYLLDTARSVSETAYWWDRHYWPRRSYGRDAAYIRSLIHLYRYLGERSYLDKAQEALHRVVSTQLPDGSFADQGSTVGIHAAMNLIVKPWMGCIATEAMIDYLAWHDDEAIEQSALKYCQWLLDSRFEDERGKHWTYQVSHACTRTTYGFDGTPRPLGHGRWHVEYLAKLMGWAAIRTGDPAFYEAWRQSYEPQAESPSLWDHNANKILTNLTWLRSQLWRATLSDDGVLCSPRKDIASDLGQALIASPKGTIRFSADGKQLE